MPPLWAFCLYRVGRDRHACEEVVQETLLRAIERLADYDPARCGDEIHGWLTGIARNEIRRVRATAGRTTSLDDLWARVDGDLAAMWGALETAPIESAALEREETRILVHAAMAQLPPQYRTALEAKYVSGRSVREIAAETGQSEKAAESLLTRARDAFRTAFLAIARNLDPDSSPLSSTAIDPTALGH